MPAIICRTGPRAGFNYDLLPNRSRVRLGRLGSNQLQILDKKASREHAEIVAEGEGYVIRDLGSRNGTYVNGDRLEEPHTLKGGDRISIGDFILDYRDETAGEIEDAVEAAVELVEDAEGAEDGEGLEVLGDADDDADDDDAKADAKPDTKTDAKFGEKLAEAADASEDAEAPEAEEAEDEAADDADGSDEGDEGVEVLGPEDLADDDDDSDEPEEVAVIESVESLDDVEGLEVLGPDDVADDVADDNDEDDA